MKKLLPFCLFLLYAFSGRAQLLHEQNYNIGSNNTEIYASAPDGQGNILFSGTSFVSVGTYDHYFLLARPDASTIWNRKSAIQLERQWQALRPLPKGGFIFGGVIKNGGTVAISLQKLNAVGFPVFTKSYAPVQSSISSLLVLLDGDYLMGGGYGFRKGFSFTRTDSLGNIKWSKDYTQGTLTEGLNDIKFTASGKIVAAGTTDNPLGPFHPKLMLVNQNGDSLKGKQLIVKSFTGAEGMYVNYHSITPLSDGGYLLTCRTDTTVNPPFSNYMGMVTKVDSSFNFVWNYVHRTPGIDEYVFTKARELADGSVLVLGSMMRPTTGTNSFQFYRFSPSGTLMQVYPFYSNICTQVYGITLDVLNDSTFMVGGRCGNNPPITYGMYVATVKIPGLPPVLPPIQPVITGSKPELSWQQPPLGQSYPNPAQDQAIIPYHLPNSTRNAKILLTDITCRQVGSYSLKTQQKQGSLPVNLSRLSNGLYLYSLIIDGKPVATRKLAVAR